MPIETVTAEKTLVGAHLDGDNLVFERFDGTTIDVGSVRGDSGDLTPEELAAAIAKGRTSLTDLIPKPLHWDTFIRPNVADLNGLPAPSKGHIYQTSTDDSATMAIVDGKMVPTGVAETGSPSSVLIAYLNATKKLAAIAAEWEFYGGETATTGGENMVLGMPLSSYGDGSIQLAVYAGERPDHPGIRWQLFCVQNPSVSPYFTIAQGGLDMPPFDRTGNTRYRALVRRTGTNQMTLELPDGSRPVINDTSVDPISGLTFIDTYSGSKPGWQMRRNYATDGFLRFTAIATEAAA